MKVVLTKPWLPPRQRMIITFPFASLYLASYLKKKQPDIEVEICDPDIDALNDENVFYQNIAKLKPDVVGVTIFSHTVLAIQRSFSNLKKSLPNAIFVGGGPHINRVGKNAFKQLPDFDYFCRGEGERCFNELCLQFKKGGNNLETINGLIYKKHGVIMENENEFCPNLDLFDPSRIHEGYFFESSLLVELNLARAVVADVPMPACYAGEISSLSIPCALCEFPYLLMHGFFRRIWFQYFILDFSVGSLFFIVGTLLCLFGVVWGGWVLRVALSSHVVASTGTVMIAVLPFILGFQLLLQAIVFDVQNVPRRRQFRFHGLPSHDCCRSVSPKTEE